MVTRRDVRGHCGTARRPQALGNNKYSSPFQRGPHCAMIPHLYILVFPLLAAVGHVSAFHVAMRGEFISPHLAKRDPISGLINSGNLVYMVNLTLGGQPAQDQVDTGR